MGLRNSKKGDIEMKQMKCKIAKTGDWEEAEEGIKTISVITKSKLTNGVRNGKKGKVEKKQMKKLKQWV